jgi:hypothetical protein
MTASMTADEYIATNNNNEQKAPHADSTDEEESSDKASASAKNNVSKSFWRGETRVWLVYVIIPLIESSRFPTLEPGVHPGCEPCSSSCCSCSFSYCCCCSSSCDAAAAVVAVSSVGSSAPASLRHTVLPLRHSDSGSGGGGYESRLVWCRDGVCSMCSSCLCLCLCLTRSCRRCLACTTAPTETTGAGGIPVGMAPCGASTRATSRTRARTTRWAISPSGRAWPAAIAL